MAKKIALIILGILIMAFFELSLYFTGRIFIFVRGLDLRLHKGEFTNHIVCMGDSHTFGVGASSKNSYPEQLETLLNLNNPKKVFRVENLGIPGDSTKHQIQRLANYLIKNDVDIVIFLTGRNNYYEIKIYKNKSFLSNIITRIQKLRIYKVMQYVLCKFVKIENGENINAPMDSTKYENYLKEQLLKAKSLCEKDNSKLLLLSYYNSNDVFIEEFAKQSGILYFNLYKKFFEAIPLENINNLVSKDRSHMNQYGYKIFTELLYEQMFLHREDLGLAINPLLTRIDKDSLQENPLTYFLRYIQGKSVFY